MLPYLGEGLVWNGIILILFGAIIASLRNVPQHIWLLIERHLCYSLHVYDDDEAFFWIKLWLGEKLKGSLSVSTFTRRQEVRQNFESDVQGKYKYVDLQGHDKRPISSFVLATGTYFFWHAGKFCWVTFDRKESDGSHVMQKPRESFIIHAFTRNKEIGTSALNEARDFALPLDGKVEVRIGGSYNWQLVSRIPRRPLDSVILDNDIARVVLDDVKTFIMSKDWYAYMGVPYRRGILLYGPPGGGKSSLVLAIASELGMNVNILSLSIPGMTDTKLIDLLSQCDNNTIVLIEDIDCAFVKRKGRDKGPMDGLTFSGLLNAIDGVAAQGGRVIFMTTNHAEKLDPALIRDGRADIRAFIDNATKDQARRLFLRFFPEEEALANEFSNLLPDKLLPMSSIQGHLMRYRTSSVEVVRNVRELVGEHIVVKETA
jgi:chaperone BCS1